MLIDAVHLFSVASCNEFLKNVYKLQKEPQIAAAADCDKKQSLLELFQPLFI
jgi:hypothetical protein